jgi:hypothetical protein
LEAEGVEAEKPLLEKLNEFYEALDRHKNLGVAAKIMEELDESEFYDVAEVHQARTHYNFTID